MRDGTLTPLLQACLEQDKRLVESGLLHPDCAATFYPAHRQRPAKGVVLMLHGFTAAPWQYRSIGSELQAQGFHAYAARLPGHGATAENASQSDPFSAHGFPKSHEKGLFASCADDALRAVVELGQSLKLPVMLVGFSAGGALAVDLLLRHGPAIERAVLIAPLLRPKGWTRRVFFGAMRCLPMGGRIIDRVPFAWQAAAPRADGWVRPGHLRFRLGNVGALFAYAHSLKAHKMGWSVPTQFILTEHDDKIDPYACRAWARLGPHAVWWFPGSMRVPHAMLSAEENPNAASRLRINAIICGFLSDGAGQSNL